MVPTTTLTDLRTAATETAVAAGQLARHLLTQPRQVSHKGFRDLVTDADIAAQTQITISLRRRFPEHGFLTEEEDSDLPAQGPIIWIIDPIDGTTNYSRQQPLFCVAIAAAVPLRDAAGSVAGYEPLAGAIYDPMRDELFSGARGLGATLQDSHGRLLPLQVSQASRLEEAVLLLDWGGPSALRSQSLAFLNAAALHVFTMRALGSAALALAWVAAGRADLYFNFNLRPWDVAAAQVILQEAGGQLTGCPGGPLDWQAHPMNGLASNGRVHRPFQRLIRNHH